ncbi:MAG: protein kinase, partial [Planctomycetota bacterium]
MVGAELDERTGTKVAIKVFDTPERGSAREGLAREVEVLRALNHPSIVRYLDAGVE